MEEPQLNDRQVKVRASSKPNLVAGALCNMFRASKMSISVLATGPTAVNQAIKAIAIATKYLKSEPTPLSVRGVPSFEKPIRSSSKMSVTLHLVDISKESDVGALLVTENTDSFKLAGAIAGRLRTGQSVRVTSKGPIPVLVTSKAICLAAQYVQEEYAKVEFVPHFTELDDRRGTSTALCFSVFAAK